jgi:hypothetical protein
LSARWLRATTAILSVPLLFGLTGCGSGGSAASHNSANPAPSASSLPPRPAELRLDNINPCTLLSDADRGQLKINKGELSYDGDSTHYAVCQWSNFPATLGVPDMRYLARLQTHQGADYALGSTTGHRLVQLDGFTGVQTTSDGQDPERHCILLVDVAPGQSLWVQYANIGGDYQGLTHEQSCQFAQAFGEDLMQNLRAQAR